MTGINQIFGDQGFPLATWGGQREPQVPKKIAKSCPGDFPLRGLPPLHKKGQKETKVFLHLAQTLQPEPPRCKFPVGTPRPKPEHAEHSGPPGKKAEDKLADLSPLRLKAQP